jgi:uracil-DNA glycosylase
MSANGHSATRLTQVDPSRWPVHPDWDALVQAFFASPTGVGLIAFLQARVAAGATVYPPEPLRALALTPLSEARMVILGQDPYHGAGQAEGLAFSVSPDTRVPPSLRNIFKELQRDLGLPPPNGSLLRWAGQGVLLLNTCLTVEDGQPASHAQRGWEQLTDAVIERCSNAAPPSVFLLWGAQAKKKVALIDQRRHLVLRANHPSPLSARRGPQPFLGCGHFGEAGRWLVAQGRSAPRW